MHPGHAILDDKDLGEFDFSAANTLKAVGVIGLLGGGLVGVPMGIQHLATTQVDNLATSLSVVETGYKAGLVAHAGGIKDGMIINGTVIPEDVAGKLESLQADLVASDLDRMAEMRHEGMSEALSGNWSADRLDAYLDRIVEFEPAIARMIDRATDAVELHAGNPERGRMFAKAHVASVLTGKDVFATRNLSEKIDNGDPATRAIAETFRDLREDVISHLGDTGAIGALNATALRDMAADRAADALKSDPEEISEYSAPGQ